MSNTNPTIANRLCLDYLDEAERLQRFDFPIIDVHSHIGGTKAAGIYRKAAEAYGVGLTYSMTDLEQVEAAREELGDRIRFIAVPNFSSSNPLHAMTDEFIKNLDGFYAAGARIAKFWAAPRGRDFGEQAGDPNLLSLTAPHRIAAMEAAADLGMIFMAHISDPNTWFETRYKDASRYGTKMQQYEPLEMVLERFRQPWILAHMGGWPEDLDFLSTLLERHPNVYLDSSATKWMVRELSKHSRSELIDFLTRWKGRVLFGSDIVVRATHLSDASDNWDSSTLASSAAEAFDLYASRYFALRTMLETDYEGESPIADPDLAMVNPALYNEMSAPELRGKELPVDLLRSLYYEAANDLLEPLHQPPKG